MKLTATCRGIETPSMLNPFAYLECSIPEQLVELLYIEKKSVLEKFAKKLEISQGDFVALVSNAQTVGYFHQIKYHDFQPQHLQPTDEEISGLGKKTSDGKISNEGQKFIRKVSQLFEQRRRLVAHIFYNPSRWHLFYFDQRDTNNRSPNHWNYGSHIHFVNDLWPGYDRNDLWNLFDKADASIGGKLHIRFKPERIEEQHLSL